VKLETNWGFLGGAGRTLALAWWNGWPPLLPPEAMAAAAVAVAAGAGLYPAFRAARMSPAEALRAS